MTASVDIRTAKHHSAPIYRETHPQGFLRSVVPAVAKEVGILDQFLGWSSAFEESAMVSINPDAQGLIQSDLSVEQRLEIAVLSAQGGECQLSAKIDEVAQWSGFHPR